MKGARRVVEVSVYSQLLIHVSLEPPHLEETPNTFEGGGRHPASLSAGSGHAAQQQVAARVQARAKPVEQLFLCGLAARAAQEERVLVDGHRVQEEERWFRARRAERSKRGDQIKEAVTPPMGCEVCGLAEPLRGATVVTGQKLHVATLARGSLWFDDAFHHVRRRHVRRNVMRSCKGLQKADTHT